MTQIRYIVNDVDAAVNFYVSNLGFQLEQQYEPAMAILLKDDLSLWVAGMQSFSKT
jgi:catechol 2,3-dioxygenase-like lactoylglutathione lyase family enzyme